LFDFKTFQLLQKSVKLKKWQFMEMSGQVGGAPACYASSLGSSLSKIQNG
jgi:hypothetical protein